MEESQFCEACQPEVLKLIKYVRQLEDAQTVAREALDMLRHTNDKLALNMQNMRKRADYREKMNIEAKVQNIHNSQQKMIHRQKLGAR